MLNISQKKKAKRFVSRNVDVNIPHYVVKGLTQNGATEMGRK